MGGTCCCCGAAGSRDTCGTTGVCVDCRLRDCCVCFNGVVIGVVEVVLGESVGVVVRFRMVGRAFTWLVCAEVMGVGASTSGSVDSVTLGRDSCCSGLRRRFNFRRRARSRSSRCRKSSFNIVLSRKSSASDSSGLAVVDVRSESSYGSSAAELLAEREVGVVLLVVDWVCFRLVVALVCLVTTSDGSKTVFDVLGVVVAALVGGFRVELDTCRLVSPCSDTNSLDNDGSLMFARAASSSSSDETDPSEEPMSAYKSEVTLIASVVDVVLGLGLGGVINLALALPAGAAGGFLGRFNAG